MSGLKITLKVRLVMDGGYLTIIDTAGVWHLFNKCRYGFKKLDIKSGNIILNPGYKLLFQCWKKAKGCWIVRNYQLCEQFGGKVPVLKLFKSSVLSEIGVQKGEVFNLNFENNNEKNGLSFCLPHYWVKSVSDLKTGKVLYENKNPSR